MSRESLDTYYPELGKTLGQALLAPTKIYVKALRCLKDDGVAVKACSHITGGGFYENVPRMLPDGVRAVIRKDSYEVPPIFGMLAAKGQIEEKVMYNTYNMGIGMVLGVEAGQSQEAIRLLEAAGEQAFVIGEVISGEKGVDLC